MWQAILAESAPTFWLPRGASTISADVDLLFNVIMWICIFFFLLVTILLVVFTVIYRHKPGKVTDTAAGHSTTLELTWTLIPSIMVVFLYYYGFRHYMDMTIEPPNSYEVTAKGAMWQWSFAYSNGHTENELHIPINQPIRTVLEWADVIHSLYIPAFRMKKDVVPGRFNRMWFQATDANYAEYLTRVTIDGKETDIAVDSNGVVIGTANNTTPRFDTVGYDTMSIPAQSALTSAMPGVKIAGKDPVRVFMLCNGATYYLADRTADGKPGEGLLDVNGAPVTVAADFSTIPEPVQNALRGLAKTNIAATQAVQVFLDAEPYDIYCAAYCGTNHSIMRSRVIVHRSQADFDRWLAEATQRDFAGPPKDRGEKLYRKLGCAQCHTIDGTKLVGPSWKDVWGKTETLTGGAKVLVDKAYVTESILQPQAKIVDGFPPSMPPFVLKDEQIGWIMAYMQSISVHASAEERAALNGATSQPAGGPATQPSGGAVPAAGAAVPAAGGAVPATQK